MITKQITCPSLGAFLRRLPAGALVGTSLHTLTTPEQFLAARPCYAANWAVRTLDSYCGNFKAFTFCAGQAYGTYMVQLPIAAPVRGEN